MSYERQLACEQLKERMYKMMSEKSYTRLMIMNALQLTKPAIAGQLHRMVLQGYIKPLPLRTIEKSKPVTQYVANPHRVYKAKVKAQLELETTQRFSLGVHKEKHTETRPGVHVYRLLDNPLPRPVTNPKKTVVSIGSSFALLGW